MVTVMDQTWTPVHDLQTMILNRHAVDRTDDGMIEAKEVQYQRRQLVVDFTKGADIFRVNNSSPSSNEERRNGRNSGQNANMDHMRNSRNTTTGNRSRGTVPPHSPCNRDLPGSAQGCPYKQDGEEHFWQRDRLPVVDPEENDDFGEHAKELGLGLCWTIKQNFSKGSDWGCKENNNDWTWSVNFAKNGRTGLIDGIESEIMIAGNLPLTGKWAVPRYTTCMKWN
jgi:hypothetical protein